MQKLIKCKRKAYATNQLHDHICHKLKSEGKHSKLNEVNKKHSGSGEGGKPPSPQRSEIFAFSRKKLPTFSQSFQNKWNSGRSHQLFSFFTFADVKSIEISRNR